MSLLQRLRDQLRGYRDMSLLQRLRESGLRLKPIYLLLDCSEGMAGKRIQQVENAIREFHNELMNDPQSIESAFISVITFNSEQIEVFPLSDVIDFKPPKLKVSGTAAFGAALELVAARVETEVKWEVKKTKTTEEQRGDWKPYVFIMSAFEPTDDWKKGLAKFQLNSWPVIGCAVDGANSDALRQIAGESVVDLNAASDFSWFFQWPPCPPPGLAMKCRTSSTCRTRSAASYAVHLITSLRVLNPCHRGLERQ